MKISRSTHQDIINEYQNLLTPVATLAKQFGTSRHCIYKILHHHGVDTSKKQIPVSCVVCGSQIMRTKARIRNSKNSFCSTNCYHSYLGAHKESYSQNRQMQRLARKTVAEYFPLQEAHVVHHIDGNNYYNHPHNLIVFANQGDHIKHHHYTKAQKFNGYSGEPITPLWVGRDSVYGD